MANENENENEAYDPEYEAMVNEAEEFEASLSPEERAEMNAFRNAMSVLFAFMPDPKGHFIVTINGNRDPKAQRLCNFKSFSKWVGMNVECIVEARKGYVEMINGRVRVEVESL